MVVLATSCLSVLSSVLVLSIHHQRGRPSRPPLWLRRFCFSIISPLFCIRRPDDGVTASPRKRGPRQGGCGKDSFFRTGGSRVASGGEECEYLRMDPRPGSGGSNPDRVDVNKLQKGSLNNHYYDYTYTPATGNKGPGSGGGSGDVHSGARDEDSRLPPSRDDWDTREDVGGGKHNLVVRHLIGLIHTQRNEEMRDEEVFQEWHHVAYVLDRMLFAFFFLLTLVSTVCILEMRPTLDKL
ncbi:uncharacterized protein LOC101859545 [Aplysia californica]|uniref:Uncharacterized protein LOC101859545 n=1 Tax=Aplysia californica TaxID=6500 RepID=A0ABM0KBC7_APLCA|nr:uncharacterized protein LOC101859545 [Aplysia californica]